MASKIIMEFQNGFNGVCSNKRGVTLEVASDKWQPYQLLFAALSSCLYATFLDVIEKKRLVFERVSISIEGEKIDGVPSFLKTADIDVTIYGVDKADDKVMEKFKKSFAMAEKYCSIYNTLTKVAELKSHISFE